MWWAYVESAAAEHDEGDGIVRVVEAVGHADGALILLLKASSLAFEQPSSVVLRMSGP